MITLRTGSLLLLLLFLIPLPSTSTVIYVTPTPLIPCPGNPCFNLSYYANQTEKYLTSNTTMVFLKGEHKFEETIHIGYINNFSMVAEDDRSSVLVCSGSECGGFYFENISQLIVSGLKFVSESHSITAVLIKEFLLSDCTFADNCNTALLGMYSNLFLEGNLFLNNSGQGQEQEHFSPGGGISLTFKSNMTLRGENNFEGNTCLGDQCGGSAIYAFDCPLIVFEGNTSIVNNSVMDNRDTSVPSGGGGFLFLSSTIEITGQIKFVNNTVSNSFIKENSCEISGGGASFIMCNTTISGEVIFSNNSANGVSGCGGGLFFIIGSMTVSGKVSFLGNHAGYWGGGIFYEKASLNVLGAITLTNNSAIQSGGGVKIAYSSANISGDVMIIGNYAGPFYKGTVCAGGGWDMWYSNLTLSGTLSLINNSALQAGGIAITYCMMSSSGNITIINNVAGPVYGHGSGGGLVIGSSNVTISNALIANNSAGQGGGMMAQGSNIFVTESVSFKHNIAGYDGGGATLIHTSFNNNGMLEFVQNSAEVYGGGIVLQQSNMTVTGHVSLNKNSAEFRVDSNGGGMVVLLYSVVTVYGTMSLTNNSAFHSGGGMLINETCTLAISGRVYFIGNKAGLGGAIYATDINDLVYCSSQIGGAECVKNHCFFKNISTTHNNSLMVFEGNKAQSGDVLLGGSVDTCRLEDQPDTNSGEVFNAISDFSKQPQTQSMISSLPYRVCICEKENLLCGQVGTISAYPGETFSFNAVTVGQRNGTVPIRIINAEVNPPDIARLGAFEDRQNTIGCTGVNYTLFSNTSQNYLILYVYGSCSSLEGSQNRLQIPVHLVLPCPSGFVLSKSSPYGCICEDRLQKYTNSCNINGQTILRDGDYWVGYDNYSVSQGLILHPHCPFDYCKSKPINFTLNHVDIQCNNNRTGLLCGACKPGLSLAIGSTKCLSCTDTYLSLIIPFALMGLALMLFFLVFTPFTVKAGVISGLIFYASIVGANQKIFFPPGRKSIIAFFVMWFKLDLGIETCFYDGMDTYTKTWLQFVFPIYIFSLISLLILLKRCFPSIEKNRILSYFLRNNHPEAVLGTFFILSYGKIVNNVISVFSYTTLLYPNNEMELVWLYDANIKYLRGKHIPLFVVSVLFTILVIIPFTLLLLFGHLIEKQPICLLWISKMMKVFYTPYAKNHRYWPGLLLVVRLALFIIFGMNALHDYSENLLAISAATFGLLAWPWLIVGQVYKPKFKWFGVLESTFMLNLGIFTCATFYVQQSGGNQAAVAYVSTAFVFVSFLATFFYHFYDQKRKTIKKTLHKFSNRLPNRLQFNVQNEEEESDCLIDASKSDNEIYQSTEQS